MIKLMRRRRKHWKRNWMMTTKQIIELNCGWEMTCKSMAWVDHKTLNHYLSRGSNLD